MRNQLQPNSKAIPTQLVGEPPEALIGRNIFDGTFLSPLVIARASAINHNLATMRSFCITNGVELAPHGKTTMAPSLIARQIENGAWGITVANAVQARAVFAHGIQRILIANQLINEAAIKWALDASTQGLDLYCFVDSHEGLACLDRDHPGCISVLVEVGGLGGRSGVRELSATIALAERAATLSTVRLAGVAGYEGVFFGEQDSGDHGRVRHYLTDVAKAFDRIASLELFGSTDTPVLTAGGSAFFDDVVDVLAPAALVHGADLVLRSGCYLSHDSGFYAEISPLRDHRDLPPFQPALEAIGQVTSRPEPTLALIDLGKRDVSFDEGLPIPLWRYRGSRRSAVPSTWRVTNLMDQHTFLAVDNSDELAVGDFVSFGVSHPCTTFDKWRYIPEVDDDGNIVAVIATEF